jgi:hypothetical protein
MFGVTNKKGREYIRLGLARIRNTDALDKDAKTLLDAIRDTTKQGKKENEKL